MTPQIFRMCPLATRVLSANRSPLVGQLAFNVGRCLSRRCMSSERNFTPFDKMIEMRRGQAQKSVLIQVYSGYSYKELTELCNEFGPVKDTMYYSTQDDLHFILVEFEKKETATKLVQAGSFGQKMPPVPTVSPFLWLRANNIKKSKPGTVASCPKSQIDAEVSPESLMTSLLESESISDQISNLHSLTKMGELGTRLRFLTALQLESALSGAFPFCKALPFGSSVNGFGKAGCDLDLVMQLGGQEEGQEMKTDESPSRLVYHNKNSTSCNSRALVQRHMEIIADFIQHFLPGCSKIQRILHARVPIIKFKHDLTMLECDLSMTNMTALYMSELLYLMKEIDGRVGPLVCAVRRWAKAVGLTNPSPGRWISNFSLTLLTLFYLQQQQVLPSLGTLVTLAGPNDSRITAEGINCTFLRDLTSLAVSKNEDNLETLLAGFFEFYSSFDFSSKGLSLVAGKEIPKPEHSPLYIENPLERYLNVSKNVSPEETMRLRVEFRNAAWMLEQLLEEEGNESKSKDGKAWGLLKLIANPKGFKSPQPKTYRLVQVKDLFSEDNGASHPRPILRDVTKVKHKRR